MEPPDSGPSRHSCGCDSVLLALDAGIDRGRVDHDLARSEQHRVVEHRDDVGGVRHAQQRDVARGDDAVRRQAVEVVGNGGADFALLRDATVTS